MRRAATGGFILQAHDIRNGILIPRYYDPRIADELERLRAEHDCKPLHEMIEAGWLIHEHGAYVPKINYGSGPYPYIRTSDLANWELLASPKHGVAQSVFDEYSADADVRPHDILVVHEGTYLVGAHAMVTHYDGPMLYQHHLAKFRVTSRAPFSAFFLLSALGSPIVQQQIRARQFSADIIDSVVGRLEDVSIPIPKDRERLTQLQTEVEACIYGRALRRERITHLCDGLEAYLVQPTKFSMDDLLAWEPNIQEYEGRPVFLGHRRLSTHFALPISSIQDNVLIPRYYDPDLHARAAQFVRSCTVLTIGDLVNRGILALDVGDEVGKMAYGTGTIPFVRTSDLGSYELKADPKQGVSDAVYQQFAMSQDVRAGDIILVRDGTYLVGSSAMVFDQDLPLLYCGGLIKLRSLNHAELPPALLYILLNLPYAKAQIRSKRFTRDVIDTLGHRLLEVQLPIPSSEEVRSLVGRSAMALCAERVYLRERLRVLSQSLY